MSFPRYPAYKPSGVEWLGEVPEHWEVKRIASLYFEVVETGNEDLPVLSVSIHHGVSDSELSEEEMDRKVVRSDDRSKYKRVAPGDLVYNMMRAWQGAFGSVVVEGMVSPAYVVARPKTSLPTEWIEYLLRTELAVNEIKRFSRGITDFRLRLYWDEFKNLRICSPPAQERSSILRFLDRETAKIDALIAEQQRLIALLQEKRQAVISHAVTKGLNPDAPMKDSGVEWLGEVPEHWETGKIKHYFRTTSGSTPNSDKPELYYTTEEDEQGTPWIRTTDIDNDEVNAAVVFITPKALEDTACKILPVNTVLVALYGGGGTVGKNGILKIEAAVNQALCGILPSPKALPEYVHKYIQFLRPFWMESAVSARKAGNISQELVGATKFPIPPLQEQTAILRAIEEKLVELDELAKQSSESLVLLEERRSALISAAATGQIDVRGLVPEAEAA